MSEKIRLIAIIIILGGIGSGLWLLQEKENSNPTNLPSPAFFEDATDRSEPTSTENDNLDSVGGRSGGQMIDGDTGLDSPLSKGLSIRGTVVTLQEKPAGVVRVNAFLEATRKNVSQVTDKAGRFTLDGFEKNSLLRVSVIGQGYLHNEVLVRINDESLNDVKLVVDVPASLSGVLLTVARRPFLGRRVYTLLPKENNRLKRSSMESDTGVFKFNNIGAGTYSIYLEKKPYEESAVHDHALGTFTVKSGEHLEGIELVVPQSIVPQYYIEGRVTNDLNEPLQGANIIADSHDQNNGSGSVVKSEADGSYALLLKDSGMYTVEFYAGNHDSSKISSYEVGSGPANAKLDRKGSVRGTVIDAVTRQPITEFLFSLLNSPDQHGPEVFQSFENDAGEFHAGNVPTDSSSALWVRVNGYSDRTLPVRQLRIGEVLDGIVVEMKPGNPVRGQVVDDAGQPLESVYIRTGEVARETMERERREDATTDRDGKFMVDTLTRGQHHLSVYKYGYEHQTVPVVVGGAGSDLRIVLQTAGSLEIRVTLDGTPVHKARISGGLEGRGVGPLRRNKINGETDRLGFFDVVTLGNGTGSVQVTGGGLSRRVTQPFEVFTGKVTEINFDLKSSNSAIEGFLIGNDQIPVRGRVELLSIGSNREETGSYNVQTDGRFRFDAVAAGPFVLRAVHGERSGSQSESIVQRKNFGGTLKENELLRKDFHFSDGTRLNIEVRNTPENTDAFLYLFPGEFAVPSQLTREEFGFIHSVALVELQKVNGSTEIAGLDPGQYHLLCVAIPIASTELFKQYIFQSVTILDAPEQEIVLTF